MEGNAIKEGSGWAKQRLASLTSHSLFFSVKSSSEDESEEERRGEERRGEERKD